MNKCLNCNKLVKNKYCSTSCQNTHQNSARADNKFGGYKLFTVECNKCKNSFQVKEREKLFPQKEIYYCSRTCANTRVHSNETKDKIAKTLTKPKTNNHICKNCYKEFYTRLSKSGIFCSKSCNSSFGMRNGKASTMGKKSVSAQSKIKRSKNEIYFGVLCEQKFKSTKFNEPLFNGWDADIVIPELKLAIHWNGAWHYKKITKKHSVAQVQNRDRIKAKEIEKYGYESYVIKDMGKWNKTFVEEKFQEMLVYLKLND